MISAKCKICEHLNSKEFESIVLYKCTKTGETYILIKNNTNFCDRLDTIERDFA